MRKARPTCSIVATFSDSEAKSPYTMTVPRVDDKRESADDDTQTWLLKKIEQSRLEEEKQKCDGPLRLGAPKIAGFSSCSKTASPRSSGHHNESSFSAGCDSIIMEESLDPDYEPSTKELVDYAKFLGMVWLFSFCRCCCWGCISFTYFFQN